MALFITRPRQTGVPEFCAVLVVYANSAAVVRALARQVPSFTIQQIGDKSVASRLGGWKTEDVASGRTFRLYPRLDKRSESVTAKVRAIAIALVDVIAAVLVGTTIAPA